MIVVLVGPPGSGKSTQAELLAARCGIPLVEMGEILRDLSTQETPEGREIKRYIDRGLLVPEQVLNHLIAERLQRGNVRRGLILDGFPRSVSQALTFDRMLRDVRQKLDAVVLLEVPENVAAERLSGRRTCSRCGASYHTQFAPPTRPEICDRCGGMLQLRPDDHPDVVRARQRVFARDTAPLIALYEERGILHRVDASRGVEDVFRTLSAQIRCD